MKVDLIHLVKLQGLIKSLSEVTSANSKIEILSQYKDDEFIKEILWYSFHPRFRFNITADKYLKLEDQIDSADGYPDLFEMLDKFRAREVTGHAAVALLRAYIGNWSSFKDAILKVIDRDWKVGIGATQINKIFPDLIPRFDVALAKPFEDATQPPNFEEEIWYWSRKLDGVRVITIVDELGKASNWSREGNEFFIFDRVNSEIEKLGLKSVVFDGEMCIVDEKGNEDFKKISSFVKRNRPECQVDNARYLAFDYLTLDEFNARASERLFEDRLEALTNLLTANKTNWAGISTSVVLMAQTPVVGQEHADLLMDEAVKSKWEGSMFRKNAPYKGKRSFDILKVKKFIVEEFVVQSITTGIFEKASKEAGTIVKEEVLANVQILYKGNTVDVGSGFKMAERRKYKENPEEIVGMTISVRYFEETQDKDGKLSLRFPTFKFNYGKKREF